MAPEDIPRRFRPLMAAVVAACKKHLGERLVSIAVFGSIARRTYTTDSDADIFLVLENLPRGRFKRTAIFDPIEHDVETEIDALKSSGYNTTLSPVLKTREEVVAGSTLLFDMTHEAVFLHDSGHFLRHSLANLKKRLNSLGARRIAKGSRWYWLLKPDLTPGEVFEI